MNSVRVERRRITPETGRLPIGGQTLSEKKKYPRKVDGLADSDREMESVPDCSTAELVSMYFITGKNKIMLARSAKTMIRA